MILKHRHNRFPGLVPLPIQPYRTGSWVYSGDKPIRGAFTKLFLVGAPTQGCAPRLAVRQSRLKHGSVGERGLQFRFYLGHRIQAGPYHHTDAVIFAPLRQNLVQTFDVIKYHLIIPHQKIGAGGNKQFNYYVLTTVPYHTAKTFDNTGLIRGFCSKIYQ